MFELLPKIFIYKCFRSFGFPKLMPMNYTLSLLYTCNSRCKTCFVYNKKADNLKLSEYEKILKKIGHSPYWITLSGGEPFLRKDIVDICKIIYKYSKPKIINIPTNGILVDAIVKNVSEIAQFCSKTQIIINLSIDAVGEQHDKIRQVPGNYKKIMTVFHKLKELSFKNVSVGIHTVISKFNVHDFSKIATDLMSLKPDSYITEIAEHRNELDTMDKKITPQLLSYRTAIDFLIHRIKNEEFSGLNKITQAFRIDICVFTDSIVRTGCPDEIVNIFSGPDFYSSERVLAERSTFNASCSSSDKFRRNIKCYRVISVIAVKLSPPVISCPVPSILI